MNEREHSRLVTRLRRACSALAAAALCAACAPAAQPLSPDAFSFALFGDAPYSEQEEDAFARVIEAVNAAPLAFAVHIGDFKSGASACSDALFADRAARFAAIHHPFVYVPGDNEWTDCHRPAAGGYDPVERLARLREMFFGEATSAGARGLAFQRQSEDPRHAPFSENLRFRVGPVLFVTMNVPGSNNNLGRTPAMDAEFARRSEANAAWLRESFALAAREQSSGVAVLFHADPSFEAAGTTRQPSGFRAFTALLAREAARFGKPVLVVHGDSHMHRIDRPLRDAAGAPLANVLRVESFGSPRVGWLRIAVDPGAPALFSATPGD